MNDRLTSALDNLSTSLSKDKFKHIFGGTAKEDVKNFIQKFRHYCEINDEDENYMITHFPLYLTGRAQRLYARLPDDVKLDFDVLEQNMMNFFAPVRLPPVSAYKALQGLKMKEKEKVQEFYERILEMSDDIELSEAQIMATFVGGLPRFIEDYLLLKEPDSLAQALRLAKQKEKLGPREQEPNKLLQKVLDKIDSKDSKTSAPISAMENTVVCFYCGDDTHVVMACPKWKQHEANAVQNVRTDNSSFWCQFCGSRTHFQIDCQKWINQCMGHTKSSMRDDEVAQTIPNCTFCGAYSHCQINCAGWNELSSERQRSSSDIDFQFNALPFRPDENNSRMEVRPPPSRENNALLPTPTFQPNASPFEPSSTQMEWEDHSIYVAEKTSLRCKFCHHRGHIRRNCPKFQKFKLNVPPCDVSINKREKGGEDQSVNVIEKTSACCKFCNHRGHIRRNCFKFRAFKKKEYV